jgi:hypothetical protein
MLLAIAAAAAMSGPHTTAFAERCAALRLDAPALACRRVRALRVAGHPIEVWTTVATDTDDEGNLTAQTIQLFVAVDTHAGWYLSDALVSLDTFHQGEHCTSEARVSRLTATATRVDAKHHAMHLEVDEDWSRSCPVASDHREYGRTLGAATCVVDDGLVPRCDVPDQPQ